MIPDISNTTNVMEILKELVASKNLPFTSVLEKLLNELALIEREGYLGASHYERTDARRGYANGFKDKTFYSGSGPLHLKVPQVREGDFYPSCLEKGSRSEQALKISIAEMYVQGVSTRRVNIMDPEIQTAS